VLNAGSGMSIDDITTDQSCTFVARGIVPWFGQKWVDPLTGLVTETQGANPSGLSRY